MRKNQDASKGRLVVSFLSRVKKSSGMVMPWWRAPMAAAPSGWRWWQRTWTKAGRRPGAWPNSTACGPRPTMGTVGGCRLWPCTGQLALAPWPCLASSGPCWGAWSSWTWSLAWCWRPWPWSSWPCRWRSWLQLACCGPPWLLGPGVGGSGTVELAWAESCPHNKVRRWNASSTQIRIICLQHDCAPSK